MRRNPTGLSKAAIRRVEFVLSGLTDEQADRVAHALEDLGPLAGILEMMGDEPFAHEDVEGVIVNMFDQHVMDDPSPHRERGDLYRLRLALMLEHLRRAPRFHSRHRVRAMRRPLGKVSPSPSSSGASSNPKARS